MAILLFSQAFEGTISLFSDLFAANEKSDVRIVINDFYAICLFNDLFVLVSVILP